MPTPARSFLLLLVSVATLTLGAAGRELAPRVLAPTSYHTLPPVIAFSGDRFLTIWRENMGDIGAPIMGAFSDASGHRISPRSFPLDLPPISNPTSLRLIGVDDGFALFWLDITRGSQMARIDREGRVTDIRRLPLPTYNHSRFAWNGTHFLAIVQRSATYDAEGYLFDREGQLVRQVIPIPYDTYTMDIAVSNGEFVVFTTGWEGLFAQTITTAGLTRHVQVEAAQGTTATAYRPQSVVSTPIGNGDVLFVWTAGTPSQAHLKSAIHRANGSVTAPSLLATHVGIMRPLEVLRAGETYVVSFTTAEPGLVNPTQWSMRLDAAGAKIGEAVALDAPITFEGSAAASNGVIVVAYPTALYPARVATVAIGPDAQPRTPELMSIGFSRQTQPILAAGAGMVLASWTEIVDDAAAVRAATVNADGEPLSATHVAPAFLAAREISWSGVHHLIVHRDLTRLMATRVGADGQVVDEQPIVIAHVTQFGWDPRASVVWTGNHWMVVWTDGDHLHVVDVTSGGFSSARRTLAVHDPLPDPTWSRRVHPPALAFDGRHALLVWTEQQSAPCDIFMPCESGSTRTFAKLLTRDGVPVGNALEVENPSGFALSVASSGDDFLVLAGTRATLIEGGRNVLHATATRNLFEWPASTDVTWDGRHYVVALRYRVANRYLAVRRLDRSLHDATAPRGAQTLAPDEQAPPSVAAPFRGDSIVGIQEGTAADGVRAVVYREAEMAPLPAPPAAPQNVRVRQVKPFAYEVTWDPSPSGDPEIYVVEVQTTTGTMWSEVARLGAGARSATVGWPTVRVRAVNAGGPSAATERSTPGKRRSVGR